MSILLSNKYKIRTAGEGYQVYRSKGYNTKKKTVDGVVENYEEESKKHVAFVSTIDQAFSAYIRDRTRTFVSESGDVNAQDVLRCIEEARDECRELYSTNFKGEQDEDTTQCSNSESSDN